MRVLSVEDDTVLGSALQDQVVADGHSLDWVTRLDAAAEALAVANYDLVLLDLMLPDGHGAMQGSRTRYCNWVHWTLILPPERYSEMDNASS